MKRAVPVVAVSLVGLVSVWRYEPSAGGATATAQPAPPPSTAPAGTGAGASGPRTVTGSTVATEKGPVQVRLTFEGEKITAVRLLQQPDHPQTRAAVPKLIAQTLRTQDARVDTVTGATITSDAYQESLQAALDASGT
ncbi:FMN-binding protein [Streptomyces sp. NPDC006552]|uniref:FMN-binding protein n=1 Tax=Streptomyces sp. NPDC006552 TaxID=3157179 RepID=UPI0033B8AB78